jgi:hypothetical protein
VWKLQLHVLTLLVLFWFSGNRLEMDISDLPGNWHNCACHICPTLHFTSFETVFDKISAMKNNIFKLKKKVIKIFQTISLFLTE